MRAETLFVLPASDKEPDKKNKKTNSDNDNSITVRPDLSESQLT